MGYLDNTSITVDAILTKRGRELLARNDGSFKITQFALGDDEIDYTLFNENHPNGSQYSGEAIENMPLIEAIPDETNIMKSRLITLERGTSVIPFIGSIPTLITLTIGTGQTYSPSTVNFGGTNVSQAESSYRFTVADRRLFTEFTAGGVTGTSSARRQPYASTAVSETVIGQSISMTAITSTSLFGSNNKLITTMTIEGTQTGARLTVPIEVSKTQSTTSGTTTSGVSTY